MKEILYIITGDKGEILTNLASVGKVVAGAVKSNMGKIVYSTGGNKGTFFDAFKAYQSSDPVLNKLTKDIFQRAKNVEPKAQKILEPLCQDLGIWCERLKNPQKIAKKIPKSLNKIQEETLFDLIAKS